MFVLCDSKRIFSYYGIGTNPVFKPVYIQNTNNFTFTLTNKN